MSLPRLAVRRPVATAMLLASILLFGGLATARLPLAFLPEVDAPFIGIEIPYPDSSPAEVDREITEPVEERLATLSGVKTLHSRSDADGAFFELEFAWGQDLDVVRMRVSELVDQVEGALPARSSSTPSPPATSRWWRPGSPPRGWTCRRATSCWRPGC